MGCIKVENVNEPFNPVFFFRLENVKVPHLNEVSKGGGIRKPHSNIALFKKLFSLQYSRYIGKRSPAKCCFCYRWFWEET